MIYLLCVAVGIMAGVLFTSVCWLSRTPATVEVKREPVEPKFKNVVEFVAQDLAENPRDWEYREVENYKGRGSGAHGLLTHKSGRYIVWDKNDEPSTLIKPTGFETFHESGLTGGVHAWHIAEAKRHLGKMPETAREAARAEVDALDARPA